MSRITGWYRIASAGLAIAFVANMARAEDPLLGEIKVIKCVGCEPGKVTLVIHDPIDVRDFDVTIQDADYTKIVTPLPGKRVFDRGDGCFYWDETPKVAKKDLGKGAGKDAGKDATPVGQAPGSQGAYKKTAGMKTGKKDADATVDSAAVAKGDGTEGSTLPEPEVKPSRCIPYVKVALPKASKQD